MPCCLFYSHIAFQRDSKPLNGPNARQAEIFTDFPLKDSFNFLMVFDVFLETQRDSKSYVSAQDDEL